MKKTYFTEEQIASAMRQVEAGTSATEICRTLGAVSRPFIAGRKNMPT